MTRRMIINGKYIEEPTDDDRAKSVRHADNAQYHRDTDRNDNYIDMIQPWIGGKANPEFAAAYPDRVKDYYSESEIKELE